MKRAYLAASLGIAVIAASGFGYNPLEARPGTVWTGQAFVDLAQLAQEVTPPAMSFAPVAKVAMGGGLGGEGGQRGGYQGGAGYNDGAGGGLNLCGGCTIYGNPGGVNGISGQRNPPAGGDYGSNPDVSANDPTGGACGCVP